jgi:hypothetical protein
VKFGGCPDNWLYPRKMITAWSAMYSTLQHISMTVTLPDFFHLITLTDLPPQLLVAQTKAYLALSNQDGKCFKSPIFISNTREGLHSSKPLCHLYFLRLRT